MALPQRYKTKAFWISLATTIAAGVPLLFIERWMFELPHREGTALSLPPALITIYFGILVGIMALTKRTPPIGRPTALMGAAGTIICGLSLLLPAFAPQTWDSQAILAAFIAMTVASYLLHRPMWRNADEMLHHVSVQAERIGMRVFFFGMLFYAAAKALGLQVFIGLWDAVTTLVLLQTYASLGVSMRYYGRLPADEPEVSPPRPSTV